MIDSLPVRAAVLGALLLLTAGLVSAAPILLQGNFMQDDDVQEFRIVLSGPGTLTVQSYSYDGGVFEDTPIEDDGFAPILTLFDQEGYFVYWAIGGTGGAGGDAVLTFDVAEAGTYFAGLTQYPNYALGGRFDGYQYEDQGNFTGPMYLGEPGAFIDPSGEQRTRAWAIGVNFTRDGGDVPFEAVALPEPGPLAPAAIGLVVLVVAGRLKRSRHPV